MEVASAPIRLVRREALHLDLPALAAWALPVVLIVYLALNNGGYDVVDRSEIGIGVWWIVMVGTAVGALPVAGGSRAGTVMLLLLTAFAAWTALSFTWTESSERTAIELGRVAAYLGVFALALSVQGRGRWRFVFYGTATAVAVVAGIAVLSRLEPTWFPERITGRYLRNIEIERQLAYPLNYSTGLAGFAAIGLPLVAGAASSARTLGGSMVAAAAIPIVGLTLWLTHSGLAGAGAAVAVGAFLLLAPERIPKLATLLAGGAGSAILIAAVAQRDALDRGLPSEAAQNQGDEMLTVVIVVCAGVALIQGGIVLASRYGPRPGWFEIPRPTAGVASATGLAGLAVIAIATGAPGELQERWESFKGDGASDAGQAAFDPSTSGRYKFWASAVDANETEPLVGIGPGTFEFWWARERQSGGFARDAHSTFLEVLAELGIVGFVLVAGFALGVLGIGTVQALRAPPERRVVLAAATAGCAAFTVAAAGDWAWELATLPITYLVLAAIVLAPPTVVRRTRRRSRRRLRLAERGAVIVVGLAAIVVIAIPLTGTQAIEQSRAEAGDGDLQSALEQARTASRLQPYASTPRLQEALIYELTGNLSAAAEAARAATTRESTNWRTWLVLARMEARRGRPEAAVKAYRRAISLNPSGVPHPNVDIGPAS